MSNPSIVIVPGAWHRPAHFQGLIDDLAKVNYEAVGVTMPSVDSSPPLPSWDQDAQAVRQVIMERLDSGKDVVVLAHSFGGIAMSEAAKGLGKKERAAQGLQGGIIRLIYMCSMALPKGQSHIGQLTPQTPEEEELEKQRQELEAKFGGMEITAEGALKLPKDNVHMILYNRCDPKDIERAVELLGTFPAGPLSVPVTYTAYREIPSTYIVCKNDFALRLPYQRRMIAQGEGRTIPEDGCTLVTSPPAGITIPADQFDPTLVIDQDILSTWLTLDFDNHLEGDNTCSTNGLHSFTSATDMSPRYTPTSGSIDNELSLHSTGFPKIENCRSFQSIPKFGVSFNSPIYLLNSGIDAKILGDRLTRIYEAIATSSASRFLEYDCNLYPSKNRYRIGESTSSSLNGSALALPSTESNASPLGHVDSTPLQDETAQQISLLGSVRFLDHFGDFYGNRLSTAARKRSDETLKAVLRAFSMQWLPSSNPLFEEGNNDERRAEENALDSFVDAWVRARSLLLDAHAHKTRSFRMILATLTFVGIVTPTKIIDTEGLVSNNFLHDGLNQLCCLDQLVTNYCIELGPSSTYGSLAEASLSIIRWAGYIRDTGAALSLDHKSILPDQWGPTRTPPNKESIADWATCRNILELDANIQSIFRKVSAETFYIWRKIINIKESITLSLGIVSDPSQSTIDAINMGISTIDEFNETISIVSHTMFWSLGIFLLVDVFQSATATNLNEMTTQRISPVIRKYQDHAASVVAKVVESVQKLPAEEMFNLRNGLGAEVPITVYHVTPSLAVTALEKAIESVIDSQSTLTAHSGLAESHREVLVPDGIWDRQIDILMKGLMSLDVTIGGSQTCGVTLRRLMRRHGDTLSECWTSEFET
ncbi:Alpha/beta hydrolase family-domain-containing protein [Penicillium brevicompactum]